MCIGGLRPGHVTAGRFRQCEQLFQEFCGGFRFLAVLGGDTCFLEQRLEVEPLLYIERRYIHVEAGHAHLILWERLGLCWLAIVSGRAKVASHKHDKERPIDSILRPAERRRSEVFTDVFALLAGPNEIEHTTADGMLGDIAGVGYLGKGAHIAGAGAVDDLTPVGVICFGELRK